ATPRDLPSFYPTLFRSRVADQALAVPGRAHAPRQAFEQLHPDQVLEVLEQFGRRRLRHVQRLGGAVDVAVLLDRDQQHQLAGPEAGADEPGWAAHEEDPITRLQSFITFWCQVVYPSAGSVLPRRRPRGRDAPPGQARGASPHGRRGRPG